MSDTTTYITPKILVGIGSRETPDLVLKRMRILGIKYADNGWLLRSGGAQGADSAFEHGFDMMNGQKEIFLPWEGYNGNEGTNFTVPDEAYIILDKYFPAAKGRSPSVRSLLARNCQQVLGDNLDTPADLVICWMKSVKPTGGTKYAVLLAQKFGIPTINLLHEDHLAEMFLD